MFLKILFWAIFGLSIVQKFFGSGVIDAEVRKSQTLTVIFRYIKPNLELVFVLGCAWLLHIYIRRLFLGDHTA